LQASVIAAFNLDVKSAEGSFQGKESFILPPEVAFSRSVSTQEGGAEVGPTPPVQAEPVHIPADLPATGKNATEEITFFRARSSSTSGPVKEKAGVNV
jgi:hypothetical protein